MIVHPTIHLEIARQRHQDALARAERRRIAKAFDRAESAPTLWRRLRERASASPPSSTPEIAPHLGVQDHVVLDQHLLGRDAAVGL
jgi:hypothetical protein